MFEDKRSKGIKIKYILINILSEKNGRNNQNYNIIKSKKKKKEREKE